MTGFIVAATFAFLCSCVTAYNIKDRYLKALSEFWSTHGKDPKDRSAYGWNFNPTYTVLVGALLSIAILALGFAMENTANYNDALKDQLETLRLEAERNAEIKLRKHTDEFFKPEQ